MNNEFLSKLKNYIELNKEELIQDWLEITEQPSISSTGEGIGECCRLIVNKMQDIGINVTVFPVEPYPAIFGSYGNDPKKKTILIYAHYDVQPPEPLEEWRTPPFEPAIINNIVYARGSSDNKGPLMAHLKAAQFFIKEYQELPVNLKFIFEGCEENGSQGLPQFLAANKKLLDADLVFFSDGPRHESGVPTIALGCKGMLSLEISLKTLKTDAHSMYAPVLPSAAWQLLELLNKLKSNEKVNIPGFYDDVEVFTQPEKEIINKLPDTREKLKNKYGPEPLVPESKTFYEQLLNTPTFNISGISAGYTGAGGKTIIPAEATAKIDIRLVPNQSGEDILAKLTRYVKDLGYENVKITKKSSVDPSKTQIDTPYLPLIEEATKATFGDYIVYPCRPSTAPDYLWSNILRLPAIQVRWCDADSGNHAPNESLAVSTYLQGIELTGRVIKIIGDNS